jgi:hypothetical protein
MTNMPRFIQSMTPELYEQQIKLQSDLFDQQEKRFISKQYLVYIIQRYPNGNGIICYNREEADTTLVAWSRTQPMVPIYGTLFQLYVQDGRDYMWIEDKLKQMKIPLKTFKIEKYTTSEVYKFYVKRKMYKKYTDFQAFTAKLHPNKLIKKPPCIVYDDTEDVEKLIKEATNAFINLVQI